MHALNLAEALVGGASAGRGAQLLRELEAAGIRVATPDQLEALRLAELRLDRTQAARLLRSRHGDEPRHTIGDVRLTPLGGRAGPHAVEVVP